MIILSIHASDFSFSVREKAIKNPEEPKLQSLQKQNALVVFTTVEKGDDDEIVNKAVKEILNIYSQVKPSCVIIYPYAHLSDNLETPSLAISILEKLENKIRENNVEVYRTPFGWYKQFSINCYGHPLSELSKRIRHEVEYQKSEELSICDKFGFPSSPHAYFMRNAIIEFLKAKANADTVVGEEEVYRDNEIGVIYKEPTGRRLPCINESPRILVRMKKKLDEIPESFTDSKNEYKVVKEGKGYYEYDVNLLTYYFLLNSQKESPPTLPIWLTPIQVRIIPVKEEFVNDAISLAEKINARVDIDDLKEGLGGKIARAGKEWVPYVIIMGEREVKTQTLTVKVRKRNEQRSYTLDELNKEIASEDFLKLKSNLPILLSKRNEKYVTLK